MDAKSKEAINPLWFFYVVYQTMRIICWPFTCTSEDSPKLSKGFRNQDTKFRSFMNIQKKMCYRYEHIINILWIFAIWTFPKAFSFLWQASTLYTFKLMLFKSRNAFCSLGYCSQYGKNRCSNILKESI